MSHKNKILLFGQGIKLQMIENIPKTWKIDVYWNQDKKDSSF